MRTTITLDDRLLSKLKAARLGVRDLRQLAHRTGHQALLLMQGPRVTKRKDSFELVTFGAGGKFSKLNIDKTSLLLEAEDVDRFARRP